MHTVAPATTSMPDSSAAARLPGRCGDAGGSVRRNSASQIDPIAVSSMQATRAAPVSTPTAIAATITGPEMNTSSSTTDSNA
jgi:hypothetical protein